MRANAVDGIVGSFDRPLNVESGPGNGGTGAGGLPGPRLSACRYDNGIGYGGAYPKDCPQRDEAFCRRGPESRGLMLVSFSRLDLFFGTFCQSGVSL